MIEGVLQKKLRHLPRPEIADWNINVRYHPQTVAADLLDHALRGISLHFGGRCGLGTASLSSIERIMRRCVFEREMQDRLSQRCERFELL